MSGESINQKIGSHTTPLMNNSWQFDTIIMSCLEFRSSSEIYSDLEIVIMSTTINCPDITKRAKNKNNLYLEKNLKGYTDLSAKSTEFNDSSHRLINFSNGRVYLD